MFLYRISKAAFANDLQGTGCLYTSGRWHYRGTRLLYTSQHISLAKLEVLANSSVIPKNQVLVTLRIPEDIQIKELISQDLPADWWQFPYPNALADLTEHWIDEGKFWIMKVPSAQSQTEFNYLLNPLHTQHQSIQLVNIEHIHFDKRLK